MTRERVILMLLSTGPAARCEILQNTGWGIEETNAVVDRLVDEGKVVAFPGIGNNQRGSVKLCLPQAREQVLEQCRQKDRAKNAMRARRMRVAPGAW